MTEPIIKRRMPKTMEKHLIQVKGGKMYLPAAYRIAWFRDECPDWGIDTCVIEGGHEAGFATVRASVSNPEGRIIAVSHKTESKQDFAAGWVEKAETGAIARALAVAGFGTQFTADLDEMGHVADSPHTNGNGNGHSDVWEGPDQCPTCHAPAGKRHGKVCVGN